MSLRVLLSVAAGGAVGAVLRWSVAVWLLPPRPGTLPLATLAVNLVGSLVLGLLMGLALAGRLDGELWRGFAATGLCGALTTFSTFSVETVALVRGGHAGLALAYTAGSVLLCFVLAGAGLWLGERLA